MGIALPPLLRPVRLRPLNMAQFGKFTTKIPKGHPVGKGSRQALLPSRSALKKLTTGAPIDRSVMSFAALTPSGMNAPGTYQDIQDMAADGIDIKKGK